MDNQLPFAAIAAASLNQAPALLAEWLPGGRREGNEWKTLNPLRADSGVGSFSINLASGAWADFATGDQGGDLISLYAYLFAGGDQGAAAVELANRFGIALPPLKNKRRAGQSATGQAIGDAPVPQAPEKKKTPWAAILPIPDDAPAPPLAHEFRGIPAATWWYRDVAGRPLGMVCRFVASDGGKEVIPLTFCRHTGTGSTEWRWLSFPEPRPLYGLDRLAAKPEAALLIVEGEKCADVGHEHLPMLATLSWPGGGKAVGKADWAALAAHPVKRAVLWPDCDAQRDKKTQALLPDDQQPGVKAMRAVADRLLALGFKVWIVDIPPPGLVAGGWDIADAVADGWDDARLQNFVRDAQLFVPADGAKTAPNPSRVPAGEGEEITRQWIPNLIYKKGDLAACLSNVYQILAFHDAWAGVVAYDEFSLCVKKRKPPPTGSLVGEWDSTDDSLTAMWLSREYSFTPSSALVAEAVEVLARAQAFHPVRDWLRSLTWDGTPRLECWLADHLGVAQTDYSMRAGKWWLMGAVKRVMQPGCKFDYCLVLSGNQGKKKSTVFEILAGEWFGDTDLDLAHKDSMSALRGKLIYEIAELGALARSEEKRQKSFLSRRVDEYRPVYGRREIKAPRQLVFGGSTNEDEWNKDPTGGRRFWPVDCLIDEIDIEALRIMRDQLWAEAFHRVQAGERYWPTLAEQVEWFDPEQWRVEQQESLIDAVHDWVWARVSDFSVYDVASECLKLDASKLTRDMQTRLGIALRKLGCTRVERRNGMVRRAYKPPVRKGAMSMPAQPAQQEWEADDAPL